MIEDEIKLIQVQESLEKELSTSFRDLSLYDTIHRCLLLGQVTRALKLKTDFKMSDKRYWWIKTRALIQSEQFGELEKQAKSHPKQVVLGYIGVIESLIDSNYFDVAGEIVQMMLKSCKDEKAAARYMAMIEQGKSKDLD